MAKGTHGSQQKLDSWANKDKVLQIKEALMRKGYSIWFDEQRMVRIGNIYKGMYDGLNNSKIVCSFLSVHYEVRLTDFLSS